MTGKRFLIITLVVLLAAYLGWLGYLGLRAEEPRRAVVAIEMMKGGDYIMPHLLGWPYYNKPPLFNWVMIAFFKISGSFSEWVVRMPSMLSLLLLAFLNWRLTRKYLRTEVSVLSSLFLLTSADILFYGSVNTGEIDLFFSLLVYLNIMSIYIFLERGEYLRLFLVSYVLAALGFLTKGPPAIVFHGLTLVMGAVYFRSFRQFLTWKHLAGILVFTGLIGGYMSALHERGEMLRFISRQLVESTQRTGVESAFMSTLTGLFENPLNVLKTSLPWSLGILGFFSKSLRKKVMANRLVVFSILVFAVNFPVYWISGEFRGRYVYPLIPFLCIVYAEVIYEGALSGRIFRNGLRYIALFMLFAGTTILAALFFIPAVRFSMAGGMINGILLAAGILLTIYSLREKSLYILSIVMLMGILRIAMNNSYLVDYEVSSETTKMKQNVDRMIALAGGQDINIAGSRRVFVSTIKIFGMELWTQESVMVPELAYQIPYYYARGTNQTMHFTTEPDPGSYFLLPDHELSNFRNKVLYTYIDHFNESTWHLVKIEEKE